MTGWTIDPFTRTITSATIVLTSQPSLYGLDDEDYKNIAAHELGHAIGLGHSGPPGILMWNFTITTLDAYLPPSKSSQNTLDRLY